MAPLDSQDVLDFNRMERGGFSSVSLPFSLHNVMRSIFSRVEVEATARSLSLETSLDPKIDEVAKRAALGTSAEGVVSEGEGLVMGDEMRLRQGECTTEASSERALTSTRAVITNLTTNATKFTRPGGKVSIKSELIYSSKHAPESPVDTAVGDDSTVRAESPTSPRLSHGRLQRHNSVSGTSVKATSFTNGRRASHTPSEVIVVRFEVTDTGVGIDAGEMQENRLFSPYIQTMAGKEQGGKGTGLGLSLVRQIVTLSGGRLGVKSKVGEGSTFWFE